jgi:phage/plasmid-associated DNA primase
MMGQVERMCESGLCLVKALTSDRDFERAEMSHPEEILPMENGVLNVTTGEFLAHADPAWRVTRWCPLSFDTDFATRVEDASSQAARDVALLWRVFRQIIYNDPEKLEAVLNSFAAALYHAHPTAKVYFHKGMGRNGKSTMCNLMCIILGEDVLFHTFAPAALLAPSSGNANHHSAALVPLRYSQFAYITEVPNPAEMPMISMSTLKAATGGDGISARDLQQKGSDVLSFKLVGQIHAAGNNLPPIQDPTSPATGDRVTVFEYESYFYAPGADDWETEAVAKGYQRERCFPRDDAFAARVTGWLEHLSHQGCTVLVGDPGRHFLDKSRLVELAAYPLPQVRRWRKEAEGGERGERESERK